MRKMYSLKHVMFTATVAMASLISANAQVPLMGRTVEAKTTQAAAQQNPLDFTQCPTDKLMDRYIQENGLQQLYALGKYEKEHTSAEVDPNRAVRTIPVVFHVVYDGNAATNVSNTVINNLLLRLNQDFRKNNSLIASIRPAFAGLATDAQIEFCLATKDPSGAATTGINRRQTSVTYFNPDLTDNGINYATGGVGGPNAMKGATYGIAAWDRSKYVNIWICDITNGANFGTAGYAYVPACANNAGCLPTANIDGIVLDYNIGVQGGSSRAISHEMGHHLGLDHTWGDANGTCGTGDDGFSDTPPIKGPYANYYGSCSSSSTYQSCTSGTLWMHENMMDYSDCYCMFTLLQSNYMNSVLSGNRASLVTSTTTNCAAATPTVPVANFSGCNASVNQGSTVTFTDLTTGVPTSWAWSITPATGWAYVGGTSATSQNPQVQFTATGNYTVALTATNSVGSNTKTSNACITVVAVSCNSLTTALTMGFEASESLTGWAVENTNADLNGDGDPNTWGVFANQTGLTAHGGTQMIGYLYNEDGTTSANDWFYTPCLSLTTGTTYTVSFWHKVGASNGTTYPEKLRVKLGNQALSTAMTQTIVDLGTLTNTGWIQQTSTFTVATAGNYYMGWQCYSAADEFFLVVDDINISKQTSSGTAPVANFSGCGNYTAGTTVTLTNTSSNTPTSNAWSITPATGWSFANGTSASSANPQITFTAAGTYSVSLTATNASGSNTKTTSTCITITSGGGAGLEDLNFGSGISLYPNPTTGLTTITVENSAQYSNIRVKVYNAVGEVVYNVKQIADVMTLDLSAFSAGIYFVEFRANEAVTTKRIVLSK